jgi:small subunit ribosomal protein S17
MKKMPKNKAEEADEVETQSENTEETSVVDTVVEAVTSAAETVVETVNAGASAVVDAIAGDGDKPAAKKGKRAERIGVVSSDKMTKTVVVNVDRKVKHPIYRKYVRKRKKFMAHDEMGAKIGDKVRIMETRPMSARKRWRVVEIIQKAEL